MVIALITEGANRTVVSSRSDFEAAGGIGGNSVFIREIEMTQLNSPNDTNICYDLRVGSEYRDHRDLGKKELKPGQQIQLQPGAAVIVQTLEHVHLPRTMFGHIVPKVGLLQEGISNTSSKVDPGYDGHLLVSVFNLGRKHVSLNHGQRFCCLYLMRVDSNARPYDKSSKKLEGRSHLGFMAMARDWLERNNSVLMVLVIIFTLFSTVAQILQFIKPK
jgi:dCTP deaminase